MNTTMSDDENREDAETDFSDRHVSIDTIAGKVVAKDDRASLEELEETANRLMDRAEEVHERFTEETDSGGSFQ